jgi:glycosyltransferase involved in cell wall biosynthesis
MEPFFSIILPTFNRAHYLERPIQSVLEQTFGDFELLIVDDGSTDNTESLVQQTKDARIKYFKKNNEERSIARNFGVNVATGQYVCFLDSDDKLHSNHLEVAHNVIVKNNYPEVCHLGFETINENGDQLTRHIDLHVDTENRLIEENIFSCNAIFIRHEIANQYPFINHRMAVISEDWYVWLRLISRFTFCFDPTITSSVIEHNDRSLRNINPDKLIASTNLIIQNLEKDDAFKAKFGKKVNYFFSNQYTLISLVLALTKRRRALVLRYLVKAMKSDLSVARRRRFLASIKHWF